MDRAEDNITLDVIARIENDFTQKFGVPRQSGLVSALRGRIVFEEKYRDESALRGLEGFSHIWLLWGFSKNKGAAFSPTVRPPRLGGNTRMGVFATRSPFRPNPLGLSCVRLLGMKKEAGRGTVLTVEGADLVSGTPIYDIKPYIAYADCVPDAVCGFASDAPKGSLRVEFPKELAAQIPAEKREALTGVLELDPRPSYENDPKRRYGISFAGFDVGFKVDADVLTVTDVERIRHDKLH